MMQNLTEYNETEDSAAQFYRNVAAQYIQLTYSDKDSWLATGYNYLAYACNHIMVLLGDLMSYFSCNSVNKQLKTDVFNLNESEAATLYLACADEEKTKEDFNNNACIEAIDEFIADHEASNPALSNHLNYPFLHHKPLNMHCYMDVTQAKYFLNNYTDAAYEVPSFSRQR